jgi:serine/threonine-protein kinase
MLYQMLTGKLPYTGDSMASLMYAIANEEYPDILSIQPTLPIDTATIITKALEKDIDKRYADGQDMADDIQSCLEKMG